MSESRLDSFYIQSVYELLSLGKELYDLGRMDLLERYRQYEFDPEGGFDGEYFCYENIYHLSEEEVFHSDIYDCCNIIRFYDSSITEYFALCKEHARRKGVPLREDPYVESAMLATADWLDSDCPCCAWKLRLFERNNSRAHILFYYDADFQWFEALFTRMLHALHFYRTAVRELREELHKPQILLLPARCEREVAA